jgi:hypothetical protein
MPTRPPISELEFLRNIRNHKEFSSKVRQLCSDDAAGALESQAAYVGARWAKLGITHLNEARAAFNSRLVRSCYSRCYYGCYNLSKAVRFLDTGAVSLKGDDHQKAPDLPEAFPDRDRASLLITTLYQCRLMADYDNWSGHKLAAYPMTLRDAIEKSFDFAKTVRGVMRRNYGVKI